MKKIIIISLFLCASVYANTNSKSALIIGDSKYENLRGLQNTLNDSRNIEKSLRKILFRTKLVTDANETTHRKALKVFAFESNYTSVSLIFYAGHWAQITCGI